MQINAYNELPVTNWQTPVLFSKKRSRSCKKNLLRRPTYVGM